MSFTIKGIAGAMIILLAGLALLSKGQNPAPKDWDLLDVPGVWEDAPGGKYAKHDGFAWYRCLVKVPLGWKGDDLTLTVHRIDNCHEAYVNGIKVGSQGAFPPRYRNGLGYRPASYTVPAGQVRAGEYNLVALRIFDAEGKGGFKGAAPILANDAQAIALKGKWWFRTGDDLRWAKGPLSGGENKQAVYSKVEETAAIMRRFYPGKGGRGGLTPAESLKRFKVAGDLAIDQVLAEPIVRQPVFVNFDERGRLWVVQYLQYPNPAGLKMISRDVYWRAVYDKVPPPPPHHFPGKDKITIHEDTDGDGIFDKHTTFLDGLNIVTAAVPGRSGVWVLNPPYLLFYPDKNHDDIPDGPPVVHLEGFGLEDTHSVVNSLCWGPDGWLYGAQGSTVSGHVKKPSESGASATGDTPHHSPLTTHQAIHSMGQLIWRYHPEKRIYEIFAEGGGNAFGVEIDSKGRIFSGHNGGNTRGFHYVQGGYYQKGFSKHGPLSNPYAFGYFPAMPHPNAPRFSHTFVKYEAGALPAFYEGKLFAVAPLQSQVVCSDIFPQGSSFQTRDLSFPLTSSDSWFRPVDIKIGPDGNLYIADWYDGQVNHYRNHEGQIDPTTGRIYRLRARESRPGQARDLSRFSTAELVRLLGDKNRWTRQTVLRLIGDRKDRSVIPALTAALSPTGQLGTKQSPTRQRGAPPALESLWALYQSGGFTEEIAGRTLDHADPHVRLWTVRLLGDDRKVSLALAEKLVRRATIEDNVEVRSQLACSARRFPSRTGLLMVRQLLAHSEDVSDPHLPLLLWWALEARAESDRDTVVKLFDEAALWKLPMVEKHILERLLRRYAQAGKRKDLLTCARLLNLAPGPEQAKKLLAGFEQALAGRSLANLPEELVAALARHGGGSLSLRLRQGKAGAVEQALKIVADPRADIKQRLGLVQILGEIKQKESVPVLLQVLSQPGNDALRQAALIALSPFADQAIAARIIQLYGGFSGDVRAVAQGLLASRKTWSRQLLEAVDSGKIDRASLPLEVIRKLTVHKDDTIVRLVAKHWDKVQGATTSQMQKKIERYLKVLDKGNGSPYSGKKLFANHCGKCHALFGKGGRIGPDLTSYKRDDLASMLLNIVNPSAEIREGFETHLILTQDGRALTGFLVDQDKRVVVLRGADGADLSLLRKNIEDMRVIPQSIMPEGLLDSLADQQVRDLFAYLRIAQPLND